MLKKSIALISFMVFSLFSGLSHSASAVVCTDYLSVSPTYHQIVSKSQGNITPQVTSNTSWSATSSAPWAVATTGVFSFTVDYEANLGTASRTAIITLSTSCATKTYTLEQQGYNPISAVCNIGSFTATPSEINRGDKSELSWTTTDCTNAVIYGPLISGSLVNLNSGSSPMTIYPPLSNMISDTYTLFASGSGSWDVSYVTVTPKPNPVRVIKPIYKPF
jgi:hypothetical protein